MKVAAGFHYSSNLDDSPSLDDDDDVLIHQILNYDHWLAKQDAAHKAGFVLALSDMTQHLPDGLSQQWNCTTWAAIAHEVEAGLGNLELEDVEKFLARHFLGFVYRHLIDTKGDIMGDFDSAQLSFDDVALIRAYSRIGNRCSKAVEQLIRPLITVMEEAGLFTGEVRLQSNIFKNQHRRLFTKASSTIKHQLFLLG